MNLETWKNSTLKNYLNKHTITDSDLNLLITFLVENNDLKLERLSVPQALNKAKTWQHRQLKKAQATVESGIVEEVYKFSNGLKFVRLVDQASKIWEGKHMGHCVGGEEYQDSSNLYSLRDRNNFPHATLEINGKWIEQINGKSNKVLADRYQKYLIEFFKNKQFSFYNNEVCEKFNYTVLSEEEIFFRRISFDDSREFCSETVVYGPISAENLTVKKGSFLEYFIKTYPSFSKPNLKELSFFTVFEFFFNKNDVEMQARLLTSVGGRVGKTFLDIIISKSIRRARYKTLDLLLPLIPKGNGLDEYVDEAVSFNRVRVLDKLYSLLDSEEEKSYFVAKVARVSMYCWCPETLAWANSIQEIKITANHILDALRSREKEPGKNIEFFKEIVLKYKENGMEKPDRIFISALSEDPSLLKILIELGIEVPPDKQNPVMIKAISSANWEAINQLLALGYKMDFPVHPYLANAARKGSLELVEFLLDKDKEIKEGHYEALSVSYQRGHTQIRKILLRKIYWLEFLQSIKETAINLKLGFKKILK